ncbi:MAG TPA: 4-phosphopantetheinyl transferase [Arthrobacter bacterium]|nr:4-phosphopantetheinyl transferase [Arthrobacter sp.]HAP90769.1 4-phosphopantetheinyl transferase [Arthrobacter sp.]HBH59098.1 4-phosphopantetheinyl transferase [Arthrobacter sp.]HCB59772.1 4-phosphopantetheinyl transferase [Arthrobacter sp.]HCC41037.1 4-phosphopantetheinyl transferase [Arthrobacter sp.]
MAQVPVLRSCLPGPPGGQEPTAGGGPLVLGPAELARAAALAPGPRAVFVAGRRALRTFVAELLDVPASDLTTHFSCPRCGAGPGLSHGRPGYTLRGEPVPLALSLSRSSGWILLGALVDPPPGLTIGVDLADPSGMAFEGFDGVALTPAERATLAGLAGLALLRERARLWARKEAWLKMTGDGLATAPDSLDVLSRAEIRDLGPGEAGLPPGLRGAVAVSSIGG